MEPNERFCQITTLKFLLQNQIHRNMPLGNKPTNEQGRPAGATVKGFGKPPGKNTVVEILSNQRRG